MKNEGKNFTEAQMLRKKAEEQLKIKQKKLDAQMKETDIKRLLH